MFTIMMGATIIMMISRQSIHTTIMRKIADVAQTASLRQRTFTTKAAVTHIYPAQSN
jgi:hypothetical protein